MLAPIAHVVGLALAPSFTLAPQAVLAPPASYPVGEVATGLDAGDVDGDGRVDLVCANSQTNDVSLLLGAGDGTFAAEQRLAGIGSGVRDVGLADFDADGDLDLAVLLRHGSAQLALLRNDGTGAYGAPELSGPSRSTFSLRVDDLDADGDADVAVASMGFGVDFVAALFVNDGGGAFEREVLTFESTSTLYLTDLAVGDVDGDGLRDLVGVNLISDRVSLLRNAGGGSFDPSVQIETDAVNPFVVLLTDLDGDGDDDLAIGERLSGRPDELLVAVNDGAAAFTSVASLPLPSSAPSQLVPVALEAADLDRDGRLDLITSDQVMLGAGGAAFGPPLPLGAGGFAPATLGVDVNGDGVRDVVQVRYVAPSNASFASVVLNLTPDPSRDGPFLEAPGSARVAR